MPSGDLLKRADRLVERSQYSMAFELYREALAEAKTDSARLECLLSLADTGRMVGRFSDSTLYYKEAIILSEAMSDGLRSADARVGLGLSLRAMSLWREAIGEILKAGEYYEEAGDEEGMAFCRWAHAGALRIKGDIGGAIGLFTEAKGLYEGLDDDSGIGYCLCGLGGANRAAGDYRASMGYYNEANEIFSRIKDKFGTAYSYCGIGNAHRMAMELDRSMRHLSQAAGIYKKIGDIVSSSYTEWSMGMVYLLRDLPEDAAPHFDAAATNFEKTGDVRGQVYVHLGRAMSVISQAEIFQGYLKHASEVVNKYDLSLERGYVERLKGDMVLINIP